MAADVLPLAVSFDGITRFRGFISCLILAVVYVASLYVWRSKFPRSFSRFGARVWNNIPQTIRDHPTTIRQRFKSVMVITLFSPCYVWLWADDRQGTDIQPLWKWLGIHVDNIFIATFFPLLLTMVLFMGPIAMMFLNDEFCFTKEFLGYPTGWIDLIKVRNYIVAPLTEELVYRACMIPLLFPGYGSVLPIFICPLFFGVAHIHHVIERLKTQSEEPQDVWFNALFQFGYTTVFGAYSAFLFVRTGHLIGPVVCHSFCNFMGFPALDQIPRSRYSRIVTAAFVSGLMAFLALALPLTNPSWYNSLYLTSKQN